MLIPIKGPTFRTTKLILLDSLLQETKFLRKEISSIGRKVAKKVKSDDRYVICLQELEKVSSVRKPEKIENKEITVKDKSLLIEGQEEEDALRVLLDDFQICETNPLQTK